jgi:DNA-binding response OmpR family regulator
VTILFVEQDFARRRMVKDMLAASGAVPVEVRGAADLAGVNGGNVSLAVVEVQNDGDGLTAIERLHQLGVARPTIIALVQDGDLIQPSRSLGADEVLVEPVSIATLFEAIGRHLSPS